MNTTYSEDDLYNLKNIIEKFDKREHINIILILKKYPDVILTETETNTLVDMTKIPNEALDEIFEFIKLCLKDLERRKKSDADFDLVNVNHH